MCYRECIRLYVVIYSVCVYSIDLCEFYNVYSFHSLRLFLYCGLFIFEFGLINTTEEQDG